MFNDHDRHSPIPQIRKTLNDEVAQDGIDSCERFVKQKDTWLSHERPRDLKEAALPTAQYRCHFVCESIKLELPQQSMRLSYKVAILPTPQPTEKGETELFPNLPAGRYQHVLQDRHLK